MDATFENLIARYEEQSESAARARHDAATKEIERATWVNDRITALREQGATKTDADKGAHADPEHRARQQQVADLTLVADLADRRARATAYWLEWIIAGRREVAHVG